MIKGLEYVKETIEFREKDITGNEFETNNLLMDDILLALGYNKRREQGVKAVYSGEADWEITCNNENRFTIGVYGYGSERPTVELLGEAFNFADSGDYKFVVLTDGKKLDVYHEGSLAVQLDDIFSEESDEVLNALSKTDWAPEIILNKLTKDVITTEQVMGILKADMDNLVLNVISKLNISDTEENKTAVESIILELFKGETSTEELENKLIKDKEILLDEVSKLMAEILGLKETNEKQSVEINKLTEQLSLADKTENTDNNQASVAHGNESAYRNKIVTLTEENQALKTEVDDYKCKLEEIEKKQANKEDEKVTMARQLLDAVEDNTELHRAYVGVVNSRLFQIGELNKFVGTCIQELYSTVSFELMHLLFDGDIFKIVQPAVRGDLLINAKSYDIDTSLLNEEEVLSRLKSLFSRFEKVVFMCKTVGTQQHIEEQQVFDEEAPIFDAEEPVFEEDQTSLFDKENVEQEEWQEGNEINFNEQESYEPEMDSIEDTFENNVFEEPELIQNDSEQQEFTDKSVKRVLKLPLNSIGMVLWSEENPIIKPLAIGNEYKTFRLNEKDIFNSAVTSMLNMSNNILESVSLLEETDLTTVSANIHLWHEDEADARILQTVYFTDISDSKKYISVLLTLAETVHIDDYTTYMYFEVSSDTGYDLEQSCITEEDLDGLVGNIAEIVECNDVIHCILSGSALDKVIDVPGIKKAANELVKETVAIRTTYMTSALKTTSDIANAFKTCLSRVPVDELDTIITNINNMSEDRVILTKEESLSENAEEFSVGSKVYAIDKPVSSEVVLALYMIHNNSEKDTAIDIRVELDSSLYTHFKSTVSTDDCYEYLARSLMCGIVEGKTKVITK